MVFNDFPKIFLSYDPENINFQILQPGASMEKIHKFMGC